MKSITLHSQGDNEMVEEQVDEPNVIGNEESASYGE